MTRPRWQKIISDLLSHKIRSLLVIASIAAGLFAIGMITTSYVILSADIRSGYAAVNPANIQVTSPLFPLEFTDSLRSLPGVSDAEGAWNTSLQIRALGGDWQTISIRAQDFDERAGTPIGQPILLQGAWPPDDKEIALDFNKLDDTGASLGDEVEIKLPSGSVRRLKLTGVVKDQTIGSSGGEGGFFLASIQGYVTVDTLPWLEQPLGFNTLYATVAQGQEERQAIRLTADALVDKFTRNGYQVNGSLVRLTSEHPNLSYVDAMVAVIYLLGFLVVFLSGFLITNTFSALLNQQVQQIGVMKTVGASRSQIILMYMVLILVFSLIALAAAIPLSNRAAFALLEYLSARINFEIAGFRQVPVSILLQALVALVVPQLAGILPILQGTRISVRAALSGTAAAPVEDGGLFNHWLKKFSGLSRPLLISLRNTFRKRGRLLLTVVTLTMGGAIFIATLNVRNSIESYIERLGRYFRADVNVSLSQLYRLERVTRDLLAVPGVGAVEGWSGALANVVTENRKAGETVQLIAPPEGSRVIEPILLTGRWLAPGDQNAIALSELFLDLYPDLEVGDTIRLKIGVNESDWVVVGFFQFAGRSSGLIAYTHYDSLSRINGSYGRSASYRVLASGEALSVAQQEQLADRVEAYLAGAGYEIGEISTGLSIQEMTSEGLNILTTFLLIMSFLMAAVGSIGLMGTMSLNVMERTQEIGVMRAIGGSNRAIITIILVEGVIIGLISWLLACLATLPLSKQLADVMFQIIFDRDAALALTFTGNLIWLGIVLALSVLASIIPAYNASRLTIREVLAYE